MKISEIGVEPATGSNNSYLELQMYTAGQNQLAGHHVTLWDADGQGSGSASSWPKKTSSRQGSASRKLVTAVNRIAPLLPVVRPRPDR